MPATFREPLTLRQLQMVIHVANGYQRNEIAQMEGISPATVKRTLEDARARAGARTLAQLVAISLSAGAIVHQDDV